MLLLDSPERQPLDVGDGGLWWGRGLAKFVALGFLFIDEGVQLG